jgi:hypothetical protein
MVEVRFVPCGHGNLFRRFDFFLDYPDRTYRTPIDSASWMIAFPLPSNESHDKDNVGEATNHTKYTNELSEADPRDGNLSAETDRNVLSRVPGAFVDGSFVQAGVSIDAVGHRISRLTMFSMTAPWASPAVYA